MGLSVGAVIWAQKRPVGPVKYVVRCQVFGLRRSVAVLHVVCSAICCRPLPATPNTRRDRLLAEGGLLVEVLAISLGRVGSVTKNHLPPRGVQPCSQSEGRQTRSRGQGSLDRHVGSQHMPRPVLVRTAGLRTVRCRARFRLDASWALRVAESECMNCSGRGLSKTIMPA